MNYMARGLPVLALVDRRSETAHLVQESGAGWVTDPDDLDQFCERSPVLVDAGSRTEASAAAYDLRGGTVRPSICAPDSEDRARLRRSS